MKRSMAAMGRWAGLCLLGLGAAAPWVAAESPNLVFIFADDWGYGDLGIHGSTFCQPPRLD